MSKAQATAKTAAKAKPSHVAPIPEGFHTITPGLTVSDAEAALALYQKAFGAELKAKTQLPDSKKVMHAHLRIGTSNLFVQDAMPDMLVSQAKSSLYVYVEDIDAAHRRAVEAGMQEKFAPAETFWGDRISVVVCPFGHHWTFATRVKDPTEQEMAEGMKAWAARMSGH